VKYLLIGSILLVLSCAHEVKNEKMPIEQVDALKSSSVAKTCQQMFGSSAETLRPEEATYQCRIKIPGGSQLVAIYLKWRQQIADANKNNADIHALNELRKRFDEEVRSYIKGKCPSDMKPTSLPNGDKIVCLSSEFRNFVISLPEN
jgi:hypothetical protein